jgi:hypothetical protein
MLRHNLNNACPKLRNIHSWWHVTGAVLGKTKKPEKITRPKRPKKFCQTKLNARNWDDPRKLWKLQCDHNGILGRLRNTNPSQANEPLVWETFCKVAVSWLSALPRLLGIYLRCWDNE